MPRNAYFSSGIAAIPVNTGNFRRIRELDMLYVDKTRILWENILSPWKGPYHFISRPRRFGKSLLCSTLGEAFLGEQSLFAGLYLYDKWDFAAEKRPVIHLDMSFKGSDPVSIKSGISRRLKELWMDAELPVPWDNDLSLAAQLEQLIKQLHKSSGKQVVVIIDEYEAPLLSFINNPEVQELIRQELTDFYGQLKGLDSHLRLVFITGILKFSDLSIFSGLNNINDHTFDFQTGTLCGYTEEELRFNFAPYLESLRLELKEPTVDAVVSVLARRFNGYTFGIKIGVEPDRALAPSVYNPFALNHVFAQNSLDDKWVKSGHSGFLLDAIFKAGATSSVLRPAEVELDELENIATPSTIPYQALMLYAGYHTITAYNRENQTVTVSPPNENIRDSLFKNIMLRFTSGTGLPNEHVKSCQELVGLMFNGAAAAVVEYKVNGLLAHCPHQLLKRNKALESTYNVLLTGLLKAGVSGPNCPHVTYVGNELSTNHGDIEMAMVDSDRNIAVVLEIKLKQSVKKGMEQLEEKNFALKFQGYADIIFFSINFSQSRHATVGMKAVKVKGKWVE